MFQNAPQEKKRKRLNVMWFLGGGLLLILALLLYQFFGPNPPIVVSRQTTYVTTPLKSDGMPDYEQYILDKNRRGVSPKNNAAPALWRVFGKDDLDAAEWSLLATDLQINPNEPPLLSSPLYGAENREQVICFVYESWIEGVDRPADEFPSMAQEVPFCASLAWEDLPYELIGSATETAWSSDQLPPLADWLRENADALDLLVAASERPRFWSPSPTLLDSVDDVLMAYGFVHISHARELARVLTCRAMWHLGEGRHEQCWRNLLAVHRWARLVGQGDVMVDLLVAIAIDGIASDGTVALIGSAELPADLAKQIQADLAQLSPPGRMVDSIEGERVWALDAIVAISNDGFGGFVAFNRFEPLSWASVDWNAVLVRCNRWYDRIAAAYRQPTRASRLQALGKIDRDFQQLVTANQQPSTWVHSIVSPRVRNEYVAVSIAEIVLPALEAYANAHDRAHADLDLVRTAAALAVYRTKHGRYPDTLKPLIPETLSQMPVDVYSGKPLVYRRLAGGYLLYGLGSNGIDEGGSHQQWQIYAGRPLHSFPFFAEAEREAAEAQIPPGADDISIRVPVQAFALPTMTGPPAGNAEP